MEIEKGCFYLLIGSDGKEYVFKWNGLSWVDGLLGLVPSCFTESMHIVGRLCLADRRGKR